MSIEINPLSPALGAEIIGISPCEPLDDEAVSIIRTAWLDYGVVFIRGVPNVGCRARGLLCPFWRNSGGTHGARI